MQLRYLAEYPACMAQNDDKKKARIADAATRALQEAAARNAADEPRDLPVELGGRDGPEPIRYGDWEKKGIVSDF